MMGLSVLFVLFVVVSVYFNIGSYKTYQMVYLELTTKKYQFDSKFCDTYFFKSKDNNNFVTFYDNDVIKITNIHGQSKYLRGDLYTYFDPYSLYWFIKLHKWFNDYKNGKTYSNY